MIRLSVLVAALFVVVGCGSSDGPSSEVLQVRVDSLEGELERARSQISTLRESRAGETVEVLPVDIFFNRGSVDLSERGAAKLDSIADVLNSRYGDRQIRIEGYADNLPLRDSLRGMYDSNWELSAARAAAVVRYFQWGHDMDPARFEVVGLGSYRPIVPNDSPEQRRENRRVRIAVLPPDMEL
jgi:chemotaxis protein MotB